jgi:P27 family predicted phage terminase small subunit
MGGRGSGGHNRKPTAQKKAEGNRGRRPINKREPVPPAGDPLMPEGLSLIEQKFWRQLFPVVSGMKVMTSADVTALEQLCRFLAEEQECTALLNKMGRLIPKKDDAGKVIGVTLNPIARLRSDAARHVRSYLAVFGLGPSFRSALAANPDQGQPSESVIDSILNAKNAKDEIVH